MPHLEETKLIVGDAKLSDQLCPNWTSLTAEELTFAAIAYSPN
jgi:hypothetical protein